MSKVRAFKWDRVVPSVLVLLAGLVAYLAYAAGDAGPMVVFGHGDADSHATEAWLQIPIHGVLALALVIGGPTGLRALGRAMGVAGLLLLFIWTTFLSLLGITSFGDYSDLADVLVSTSLFLTYGGALHLTLRPEPIPTPTA
jgi:hypothetical protein